MIDYVIVGGGAGGLMCAALLKRAGKSCVVLEADTRVGRKILASGNGRCNLSSARVAPDKYNAPDFVRGILEECTPSYVTGLWRDMGLMVRTDEEGRIFPYSMSAGSVLNVLLNATQGVKIVTGAAVDSVTIKDGIYRVNAGGKTYESKALVLACGSGAGSGRKSYALARSLGHKVTQLRPAVTYLSTPVFKGLKGVRAKAFASVNAGGTIHGDKGEILFRDDGISGILSFWLSSFVARAGGRGRVTVDFAPDFSYEELLSLFSDKSLEGLLHKALADRIMRIAGGDRQRALKYVKELSFDVSLPEGSDCQVVSGGLDLSQWNSTTLESLLHRNLYCIGEMLDIDGECGGFNLHWAWAGAITVARGAGL